MNPERKTKPTRAIAYGAIAAVFLILGIWSCEISETKEGRNFISLSLPDSLNAFDSIRIVILRPASADTLDTLWHGRPLGDGAGLKRLPTRRYSGGNVDVIIQGSLGGTEVYRSRVEFRGPGAETVTIDLTIDTRDRVPPVVSLRGRDSVEAYQGSEYSDPGADCMDDRDGVLPVTVTGAVATGVRGLQSLAFHCADSAGNAAAVMTRKVNVARVPDLVKPVATLRGSPVVKSLLGASYVDSGAVCVDTRDGILWVVVQGAVNTAKVGTYDLTFTCADSAGNAASPAPVRSVKVLASLDSIAPAITRAGPDTLVALSVDAVFDPWATCSDAVDEPLAVTRSALPGVGFMGHVQVTYACKDAAMNEATVTRILKIGLFGTYLPATAECQIDTLETLYNIGASGSSDFVKEPGGKYFAITRFDLSKVAKTGLKSAKLRYFTFGHGSPWPGGTSDRNGGSGTFANYTFRVYTLKSNWTEGTGNWFWYDNQYQNGGGNWYQYYPITPLVKAVSTNPAAPTGITGADRAIVRTANINLITTKTLNLFYGNWSGNPEQVPPPNKLTVVEFDVTAYIKNTNPANDFGFLVKVDGTLPGLYIGWTTKELGDGSYTPRLMLEY
ncbi:MAG: DUF5011 domain-containing protein [Fibrobacterota bacterium]|nr:DUF5011 domain-containing protein [Fibrobacterota bacterium]